MADNLRSFPQRIAGTVTLVTALSPPSALPALPPERLADLMELLNYVYDLANWPRLDPATLVDKATEWGQLLTCVPSHRLRAAHDAAARAHTGSFPVNAYELLQGYEVVKADLLRYGELRVETGFLGLPAPSPETSIIGPLRGVLRTLAGSWGEHPTNAHLLQAATAIRRVAPGLTLDQIRGVLARAVLALRATGAPVTLAAVVAALRSEAGL
jgi:hypothetical protein